MFDPQEVFPIGFPTLAVEDEGELLLESCLAASRNVELLVFELAGRKHALRTMDMNYHHVAQGCVDGSHFLITFSCLCHSGVLMRPCVSNSGHELSFHCQGSHHGTFVMRDKETGSYWHHITGRSLYGIMAGAQLPVAGNHWQTPPLRVTTVGAALYESPDIRLHKPRRGSFMARILSLFSGIFHATGWLPWPFSCMPPVDSRLPKVERGLGVVINEHARFYTMRDIKEAVQDVGCDGAIIDKLGRTAVTVRIGERDGIPFAVAAADPKRRRPLQVFSRWYGFAFAYPECTVWEGTVKKRP